MSTSQEKRITIGILAHVDAGKTTLSEAILYKCGAIRKPGRVDHGDALLDSDSQEKERGITIFAGQAVFTLPQETDASTGTSGSAPGSAIGSTSGYDAPTRVTLLDTPGHVDFSAEMERTLKVLDYAVLVISGRDGVQSHTLTLWKLLKRYDIPTFIFVNKMDLETAGEDAIMEQLRRQLDGACCRLGDDAEEIAMCSEELLDEYLAEGALSDSALAKAIQTRKLFPCCFGSALKMEGVDELIGTLARLTIGYQPAEPEQPDQAGRADWETADAAAADPADRGAAPNPESLSYRVFRITRDKQGERLTHIKILSGTLHVRDEIGGETGAGEKVNQIRIYSGDKYETVEQAGPGTICQLTGPVKLLPEGEAALEALMVYGVRLPEGVNVHEAYAKFRQLAEEDPQLQVAWSEQLREIQLKLMGKVQLEVLREMVRRRFGMDVEFSEGRIAYKETVAEPISGAGHYEPLRHYAEVHLLLEPLPRGSGMRFASAVSEDVLDRNWQRLIMTHLLEKEYAGTLTGAPITDIRITITGGRAHEKHTEGGDFRQSTYRAVRQALRKSLAAGEMILLEPYYDFELELPRDLVGRGMADIQRMGGDCGVPEEQNTGGAGATAGATATGDTVLLKGRAPVSEMKDYVTEVASYTKGRGRLALSFGGYEACHDQDAVVAASGYDPDADMDNPADSVFCSHGAGHLVRWDEADAMMHVNVAAGSTTGADSAEADSEGAGSGSAGSTGVGGTGGAGSRVSSGASDIEDKDLQRIFDRTFKSSKSDKPSIEAKEFDSELERRKKAAERRRRAAEAARRQEELRLPEYLLVDGYNIIFAWDELKELAKANIDSAREALIEILGNYQGFRKCNVIAVFDAYKVKGGQRHFEKHGGVTVVYTQEAETADTYIERATYELSGKAGAGSKGTPSGKSNLPDGAAPVKGRKYRVRVATSDRLEQMIILGNNAMRVSAREFKREVEQVNEEISAFLKQLARRNEIENPNKLKIE